MMLEAGPVVAGSKETENSAEPPGAMGAMMPGMPVTEKALLELVAAMTETADFPIQPADGLAVALAATSTLPWLLRSTSVPGARRGALGCRPLPVVLTACWLWG